MSAEALYGLGSVCLKKGNVYEARKSFERALNFMPAYPDTLPNAWNNLGFWQRKKGARPRRFRIFKKHCG